MSKLENRIPPPVVFFAFVVLLWAVARASGRPAFVSLPHDLIGATLALLGLAIGSAGFLEFRRRRTTIDPIHIDAASALVTTGIFAYSRNPMYVGFTLMLAGWVLSLGDYRLLAGPLVFALFIWRFQILPEERVMTAKFGEAYLAYWQRVRAWV
jgi:protein-S-isoprenylcysteine O-methyltransferase Ste14